MFHFHSRASFAFLMTVLSGIPFLPSAAHADPPPAASVTVPDGTEVHLALMKDLKSGGSKAGEDVPFEVCQDVYSPRRVLLIPADTPAFGKILQSSRRGMFGKGGKLKYTIDYILMPDKTRVPLRSSPQLLRGSDNRTASIATAILLTPLSLFINGRDVSANKGQQYTMYVAAPATPALPPAAPPPVRAASVAVPMPVAAPPQSQFTFLNGSQATGNLISFDGSVYTVSTPKGMRRFRAAGIKSIQALGSVAATAQK